MKPVNKNHRRKGSDSEIIRETSSPQTTEINTSQKNHNTRKRNKNKLYSIAHSDLLGRYLTANKNITAGEIIIEKDEPLVIGPVQQSQLLCLGCYVIINNVNDYRCTKCNWPMCSSSCSGLYKRTGHDVGECKILAEISFDGEMQRDVINVYNFIVPLRCLLLKRSSQSKWNTLLSMESHNNIRRNIKTIWNLNTKTVVEKLQKYFDPDEIHTVCGILEVNCFEVTKDELSLRALFPLAFLLSHNCVPNTIHTNDEHFQLKVRASVDIPKGEPITISYAYTLHGTVKRRAHIKETKFFDCTCDRCADPTELGTNNSTITCPKCNHASLVSCSPLIEDTRWICKYRKCSGFSVSDSYVQDLLCQS